MKKYKLYITMAASLFLASSCYDLDVYPEDKLAVENFFKTQDHADQAMMGIYNQLQHEDVFGRQPGFDCLGFVGSGFDTAGYRQLQGLILLPTELCQLVSTNNSMRVLLVPMCCCRM